MRVAVKVKSASPNVLAGIAANVIVCVPWFTVSTCCTSAAAVWLASPAWLAVIVAVPAPTIVTVLPLMDATAGFELL